MAILEAIIYRCHQFVAGQESQITLGLSTSCSQKSKKLLKGCSKNAKVAQKSQSCSIKINVDILLVMKLVVNHVVHEQYISKFIVIHIKIALDKSINALSFVAVVSKHNRGFDSFF